MRSRRGAHKNTFTSKSRFYEQGGKYRSEASYENWRQEQQYNWISLYNGEKFQLYDGEGGLLTHSKKEARLRNTSITPNPLLMPYLFLLSHNEDALLSLDNLRNPRTWDELAEDARWHGVERVKDHECAVIDVPIRRSEHAFQRVYFAKDLGGLPIRMETWIEMDKKIGTLNVDDIKRYRSANGDIYIPVSIRIADYDKQGEVLMKTNTTISIDTLKVNEPINEAIFEISPSEVVSFFDAQHDVFLTINPSLLPLEEIATMDESRMKENAKLEQGKNAGTYEETSPSSPGGRKVLESTNKTERLSSDVRAEKNALPKIWIILLLGLIILLIVVICTSKRKKMLKKS
jgi:hypothetical protein